MSRCKKQRLYEENYNNIGEKMTIIEYKGTNDIVVQFDDGYKVKGEYKQFLNGSVRNPHTPSLYNKGYIGDGKYFSIDKDRNKTKEYTYWLSMMTRCYDLKTQEKYPTYRGCSVCEEWHNFQVFGEWYDKNHYEIEGLTMCLDKDILVKGNKIYSPETCIFVPERINTLFVKCDNARGLLPIGITKRKNGYIARCSVLNINNKTERVYLGSYFSPDDAFYDGYKPFKENYIKEVADYYKDQIPERLYEGMYNWIVEITD